MFRALSTRRRGYEQLGGEEASSASLMPELSRARSVPASKFFASPKKIATPAKQAKKASKVHPFFTLFETQRKKKATATPDFSRYVEYLKEGGAWDMATNKPVMYYK